MNKIIIFVKAPIAGKVKTRLCPPLSAEQAASLYAAFAKDTLDLARKVPGAQVEIAYQAGGVFQNVNWLASGPSVPFFAQQGQDLGARLNHAFNHAFLLGAQKVVVLGSDTPYLNPRDVQRAFFLLDHKEVVLGPATDGGYYLIGLNRPCAFLFDGIPWSSSTVFQETVDRIQKYELPMGLLPTYTDVDTFSDLENLARIIFNGAQKTLALSTRGLLVRLKGQPRSNILALSDTHIQR